MRRSASVFTSPRVERFAEALAIERMHGKGAERFIAERIGALALAGDLLGVARWKAIAVRLSEVRSSTETGRGEQ